MPISDTRNSVFSTAALVAGTLALSMSAASADQHDTSTSSETAPATASDATASAQQPASSASPGQAREAIIEGFMEIPLVAILAAQPSGTPEPAKDSDCQDRFGPYSGKVVDVAFEIDMKKNVMIAKTNVDGSEADLHAVSIPGTYTFISQNLPKALQEAGFTQEIFSVRTDFSDEAFHLIGKLDDSTVCLLTNIPLGG
ncbi:hypothetical protein [Roseibium sp. RKSG952]|uniref:hypothetical protein n=1 Tax=Roseibium sp. RKSG952 TaxID=2529384 RepID=UPI0012BCE241|nr:hypothetical protein [Roseibium sp. RKSG952]MTH96576.1 hypothetical protein [Roseibium sp. RKSG952]